MYDSNIDDIESDIVKMLKLGYKFKDYYTYYADSMSKDKKLITWRKRTVPCFIPKSKCKCKTNKCMKNNISIGKLKTGVFVSKYAIFAQYLK